MPIEEVLFPGYVFIKSSFKNYSVINNTIGIKKIIKFGKNISFITDEEIKKMQTLEETSKLEPVTKNIKLGQEALIAKGSLRGNIVKICSLPSKKRIDVLLSIFGSIRKVSIAESDLVF